MQTSILIQDTGMIGYILNLYLFSTDTSINKVNTLTIPVFQILEQLIKLNYGFISGMQTMY